MSSLHSFFTKYTSAGGPETELTFPRRAAIHGMAGIGKTQTALKFADRYQTSFSCVFWASAANSIKLAQSYDRFIELLDLPEKNRPEQHVRINAVKRWLVEKPLDADGRGWLLIMDNVDKACIQDVFGFLPSSNPHGGFILFTTRSHETAARLLGSTGLSLELKKMNEADASELLLRAAEVKNRSPNAAERAKEIAKSIGSLPLVLDQLGFVVREAEGDLDTCVAYIEKNKTMVSS